MSAPSSSPRVSAIVIAQGPTRELVQCVRSLSSQNPPLAEVVLVTTPRSRAARLTSSAALKKVIAPERWRAERANAGAAAARGDVLAFIDCCARAKPTWAATLARLFGEGATMVAGGIDCKGHRGYSPPFGRVHDLAGRRDFLPSASIVNLAIARAQFEALGRFDPAVSGGEDRDLSFRAQLAGHGLIVAPEAGIVISEPGPVSRARQELRFARSQAALRQKYAYFPFHDALGAWRGTPADRSRESRVLHVAGEALGWVELIAGSRSWPAPVKPSSGWQELTVGRLPESPSLAVLSSDSVGAVAPVKDNALGAEVALPPVGLLEEALPRWEEPAPWTMRIARLAAAYGWDLSVEVVARRLELERPSTWGEACLALHGIYAWATGRDRFALSARVAAEPEIVRLFPGLPILHASESASPCRR